MMQPASAALVHQMLAWIAASPRGYGETMDAWRTSCPRLTVWEDAFDAGLVQLDTAGAPGLSGIRVRLTEAGEASLREAA